MQMPLVQKTPARYRPESNAKRAGEAEVQWCGPPSVAKLWPRDGSQFLLPSNDQWKHVDLLENERLYIVWYNTGYILSFWDMLRCLPLFSIIPLTSQGWVAWNSLINYPKIVQIQYINVYIYICLRDTNTMNNMIFDDIWWYLDVSQNGVSTTVGWFGITVDMQKPP